MKATLEFNLPEENSEHIVAINGSKYYSALFDIKQEICSKLKHGNLEGEKFEAWEEIEMVVNTILYNNNVHLDDIA